MCRDGGKGGPGGLAGKGRGGIFLYGGVGRAGRGGFVRAVCGSLKERKMSRFSFVDNAGCVFPEEGGLDGP